MLKNQKPELPVWWESIPTDTTAATQDAELSCACNSRYKDFQ